MTFEIKDPVAFFQSQAEYWRRVNESKGFDLEGIKLPPGAPGLLNYDCASPFGYPYIVDLYAKVGLHRYNLSKGTNLQLARVIKYNGRMNCLSTYYITLVASDPVTRSQLPFLVKVEEEKSHSLGLTVSIARPKGDPACSTVASISTMAPFSSTMRPRFSSTMEPPFALIDGKMPEGRPDYKLPEWPSRDAFTDSKRFYLLEGSELRDKDNDWIGLYLQLQVFLFGSDRVSKADLFKLKVVKAAIQSMKEDVEPRNAKSVFVYITFKGLAIRGMSEDFERRAIIRRAVNERTGCLSLLGGFSGEDHTLGYNPNMTTLEAFEFAQKAIRDGTVPIDERDKNLYADLIANVDQKDL